MSAFVRYTLLRLLVFFASVALLWLLGLRGEDRVVLLVVAAAILSAVVSFFALRPFREAYSAELAARLEARAQAREAGGSVHSRDEDAEDAEVGRVPERRAPEDDDFR